MRGILFDPEAAHAVAARLRTEAWEADVRRERLAGEDDDEDHPWAVTTDAPAFVLEVLVDAHDGWMDAEDGAGGAPGGAVPLDLPTAPRRLHRRTSREHP